MKVRMKSREELEAIARGMSNEQLVDAMVSFPDFYGELEYAERYGFTVPYVDLMKKIVRDEILRRMK